MLFGGKLKKIESKRVENKVGGSKLKKLKSYPKQILVTRA